MASMAELLYAELKYVVEPTSWVAKITNLWSRSRETC